VAEEANLPELIDQLRRRWKLAALITLGVFLGAVVYVETMPNDYQGRSVVAFAPKAIQDSAPPSADTVRLIVPAYSAYVTSPSTIDDVAGEVGLDPDELEDGLDAAVATDTGNLTITVTLERPRPAAEAANALAEAAVDFSADDELIGGEIVVSAPVPTGPSGPPRRLLEAAALFAGALLGLSVALLLERGRPRIRSWRDIYQLTGYTILGRVPRSRMSRGRPRDAFSDPVIGTAFRTLRTNIERLSEEGKIVVLVVTSSTSGEGKTTVASLLAEAFARLGNKVLLIDADLRRRGLSSTLKLPQGRDLSGVLRGRGTLDSAVRRGWTENLSILPANQDPEASDLIAREFGGVIEEARKKFDLVIVDTPPLHGTDEGRTIATLGDGVLFVVRAGGMTGPINEGVLALEDLKVRVLGAVGNALPRSQIGPYYY
jgi:succinoglycan biosynthesis transport protein ExoP